MAHNRTECPGSGQQASQHAGQEQQYTLCPFCGHQFNNNSAGTVRPHIKKESN